MKILIGQPLHEDKIEQLENEIESNKDIDFVLFPEGYLANEKALVSARKIAKIYNTIIIGTSHADGSYRNCGVSLPISYFIDSDGEAIYISKSDIRTRIVDLSTKTVEIK